MREADRIAGTLKRFAAKTPITAKQLKFVEELLIDCGFSGSRKLRNDFLTRECGRTIDAPDALTVPEATNIIRILLEQRDRNAAGESDSREDDDEDAGWTRREDRG